VPTNTMPLDTYDLQTEYLDSPLGIDQDAPRFSWRLASTRRGAAQTAYRIEVDAVAPDGARRRVWSTGTVASTAQLGVEYAGHALERTTRYEWMLTVTDEDGRESAAKHAYFETGLMDPSSWRAAWIGRDTRDRPALLPPANDDFTLNSRMLQPPSLLRRELTVQKTLLRARLHVTTQGLYRAWINGEQVSNEQLAPGWTDYTSRILYQSHEVTELLRQGGNALAFTLADGWWSGFVGYDPRRAGKLYGNAPALLAELHLSYDDGSTEIIATDETWRESRGRWLYADLLMGEGQDARNEVAGWTEPAFDDSSWIAARVLGRDTSLVTAAVSPPMRVVRTVAPRSVTSMPDGAYIVDFGQNLVGHVRLRVRGAASGDLIELLHAETLDDAGELYLENLRRAEARDIFYPAGIDDDIFEPDFTFHGFRYVRVAGLRDGLTVDDLSARVVSSDLEESGTFDCGDPAVMQLESNIRWSQRSNFLSVPTDCPQRDERLGWLADAQVFLPTAARNATVGTFFASWMDDVIVGQNADGAFPDIAPVASWSGDGAPAWGDGGVIIPLALYDIYGDLRVVETAYEPMVRWIEHVLRENPSLLWRNRVGRNYGDWLQAGPETPKDLVATAYFANSARLVARAAGLLGHAADATRFDGLADDIRDAFQREYVSADGLVAGDTQTGYLLALDYGLLPAELEAGAAARLAELVRQNGMRLSTGFIGVSKLCPVLSRYGYDDIAHALLMQTEYPSWLFSVEAGATTIWERWDGWTPDGGFQSANMNSFNHYSLGAVGEWLYGTVGGIDQAPGSVAFERLAIRPRPSLAMRWAAASQQTARGVTRSAWMLDEAGVFRLEVTVPPGSTAQVSLPTRLASAVTEGGVPAADAPGLELLGETGDGVLLEVGSGSYDFVCPYEPSSLSPTSPLVSEGIV
jgi:alpha-L-rhamnosidase